MAAAVASCPAHAAIPFARPAVPLTEESMAAPPLYFGRAFVRREGKPWLAFAAPSPFARKVAAGGTPRAALDAGGTAEDGGEGEGAEGEDKSASEAFRSRMERLVSNGDESFRGIDLATLIRNKYGKSYDVQLIKKEFMGRQLLAMNVMWKYREQKSFPLTEEEYIYHLDSVADNLRCWGAVSTVRSVLEKTKERPRIGKAVSIFIDVDDTGGRANEWINR